MNNENNINNMNNMNNTNNMNNLNNTNSMNNFNNFNSANNVVGQPVNNNNNNNNNNKKGMISKILIGMIIGFLVCIGGIVVISLTTDIDSPDDYNNSDNYYDDSNKYNNTDNISVDKDIDKILNSASIKSSEVLCKAKSNAEVGNVPQGKYAYGDEYTCELGDGINNTFLVLSYNNDRVALIMDSNIDANGKAIKTTSTDWAEVEWISKNDYIKAGGQIEIKTENGYFYNPEEDVLPDGYEGIIDTHVYVTNEYGPITATNTLKERTSKWTKLDQSQIVLPTAKQIVIAANKVYNVDDFDKNLSEWLCDYSYGGKHTVDNVREYWTSTPSENSHHAIAIGNSNGKCSLFEASAAYTMQMGVSGGIRPVIIISKSQLR